MKTLRNRQIHLDFHTAPEISDVGRDFDASTFVETLAGAHVNSVTCFAKCHHGLFYYPSDVGPIHPSLEFDLLGEMIEACHRRDIKVPAYVSVQFDQHAARTHPQWRVIEPDRTVPGPLLGGAAYADWPTLCILTGYREYLAATVTELVDYYDVDGVFFDICMDQISCTEPALRLMRDDGFDPDDQGDRRRFARREAIRFLKEFHQIVRKLRRGLPVFFNGRVDIPMRDSLAYLTHLEVESLASGLWGYDHFQRVGRHVRTLGKPWLGMTARFHKSWADFGTLKNDAALECEVLTPVVHGGGISIGDQLHPRGALEAAVYDLIGRVFAKVRDLEPWCIGARPLAQIGVLSLQTNPHIGPDTAIRSDRGAAAMLNETHHLFDVLDADSPFDEYGLLILPDAIAPESRLVAKLEAYLAADGRLLVTGRSMLDDARAAFVLKQLGVDCVGELEHCPFYIRGSAELDLPAMDHCMYEPGLRVRARRGAKSLASVVTSYFNRNAEHYCSHGQTPPDSLTRDRAVIATKQCGYINCGIFAAYEKHGNRVYRDIVAVCIERLLAQRVVRTSLPASARISVSDQKKGRSLLRIVHVLHYPVTQRCSGVDFIQDRGTLIDTAIDIATPARVTSVQAVPARTPIAFEQAGGRARFIIPRVIGHQAVCITMQ